MKKIKYSNWKFLLMVTFIFVFLLSCNKTKEEVQIKNIINQIYKPESPFASNSPYTNSKLKDNVFSKKLYALILEAKEVEKKSRESISKNEQNNIKPYLLEGSVFVSVSEGYTSYSILKISIQGNKATVLVKFSNDMFETVWTDKITLLNENGWKLDNVAYKKANGNAKNLQELLFNFIQAY
ncbi:hypothetical protein MQE36_08440 [Zhouia spongiae]|uniref:DUF3828 domain-containing protein n=1 Tax=Zhouia spongiae TaxID=2202721 RepID=A0ABY3YVF9_9FLAO|nr:hypothetical protein [Zhouia spongiae]UNZ00354.1 hypothetical protein MQE36_08440 [Zhouia spongiae]